MARDSLELWEVNNILNLQFIMQFLKLYRVNFMIFDAQHLVNKADCFFKEYSSYRILDSFMNAWLTISWWIYFHSLILEEDDTTRRKISLWKDFFSMKIKMMKRVKQAKQYHILWSRFFLAIRICERSLSSRELSHFTFFSSFFLNANLHAVVVAGSTH